MIVPRRFARACFLSALVIGASVASAVSAPKAPAKPPVDAPAARPANVPLLPGGGSKEPINIEADKLDYFDKDQKLIYTGNVVAVQGDSTLKASVLTIFLQKKDGQGAAGTAPAAPEPAAGGSSVKRMEAQGPVTLISKDQIGTGDSGTYDKEQNQVTLTGNVTLTQGTNVTKGERLFYDMTSGQATMFAGETAPRVMSVFTPGSGAPGDDPNASKPGPKRDKAPAGSRKPGAAAKPGVTAQQ